MTGPAGPSPAAAAADAVRYSAPSPGSDHYVNTLSSLFVTIAAGHAADVYDDAQQVLGRHPRTLREFVTEVDEA